MPYIGKEPEHGSYQRIDDLTSSFDGSETTFNLLASLAPVYPGSSSSLIVSLGGVVQEPTAAYTVSAGAITFTTAPAANTDFWAIALGDTLDIGVPSDKSVTSAKLATTSFSFFIS